MDKLLRQKKQRSRTKQRICLIAASILIAASFSGCLLLPTEEQVLAPPLVEPPKITYETADVKRGTIEKKIKVSSTFASVSQENLYFKFKGGNLKSLNVKLGDKIKKGDLLAELDTDSLLSQIKQQEISVKIEELNYNNEKSKADVSAYVLEKESLVLQSVKLKLTDLRNEYNKSRLLSTITGDVVYIDKVNSGDYVSANRTLITIADPTKLQLIYKGDDSTNFPQGVFVDVKYKGKDYKGQVVASPYNLPTDANKDLKSSVFIKVEGIPEDVNIGETADISLSLDKRENVIVIPRNMVSNYSGRSYVQVLENGLKYERDVELGLQTATDVEIVKGVKEGDKLIQR